MRWYYVTDDNQQKGPIKEAEFIKLFQSDTITRETLVWNGKTVQDWCKISSIDGIEDELNNWKPGCGQLLKSAATASKKMAKENEQQQVDEQHFEEKPNSQGNVEGQQTQASQVVQTNEETGPKSDGQPKLIKVVTDSPTRGDDAKKAEELKEIIQTNAEKTREKYSECLDNEQVKVNDLDSRLSKKVEEVEELNEKMQVGKVGTKNMAHDLANVTEEVQNEGKALEETIPFVSDENLTVKSFVEKPRVNIIAPEDSHGKKAADWDKLSQENVSLRKKNATLTEKYLVYKDKMNSRVTELESQLSRAVNESKVAKEDLNTQSESKQEWAKLEKEQNILKEMVEALTEEKRKFEKFQREELVRMKSSVQIAGNSSEVVGRVGGDKGKSSVLSRWHWTLLSISLLSAVGYWMLKREIGTEPELKQSTLYSAAGERGKKLSETITNKVTDTISSKIPIIPNIPSIPSVFKK